MMMSQFLGGTFAGILISLMTFSGNCGCPSGMADSEMSVYLGAMHETLCTFILMFTYIALVYDYRTASNIHGFAIGGCFSMSILAIGNITGAALNPTRHFGPKVGA